MATTAKYRRPAFGPENATAREAFAIFGADDRGGWGNHPQREEKRPTQ